MGRYPANLGELGHTGLSTYYGVVSADEALDRIDEAATKEYLRVANDAIVTGGLSAMQADFLSPKWPVEAASSSPEDKANATFLEECRDDMSHPWSVFLEELFHYLYLRFGLFEVVYKVRGGPDAKDSRRHSKYADGRIGWRKFAPRLQETIVRWEFDEEGGIKGAYQWSSSQTKEVYLPMERLLHFRTPTRGNNPAGRSILRGCHREWSFRRRMEVVEGIGTERNLAGLPYALVPPAWLSATATEQEKASLEALKKNLVGLRVDEQACFIGPQDYDEKGRERFKFGLMSSNGRGNVDTDKAINRYDRKIAMSLLTDFLLLGHESVGSFALATIKIEMFSKAMNTTLDRVAQVLNEIAIPRLFRANGIVAEKYPRFEHETARAVNLQELATSLLRLSQAGFTVADEPTQNAVRAKAMLPEIGGELDDEPEGDEVETVGTVETGVTEED